MQAFIDEERAETTYDAKYHGLYDDCYLEMSDNWATARLASCPADTLDGRYASLYGDKTKDLAAAYRRHLGEWDLLAGLQRGALSLTKSTLSFRDHDYAPSDFERLRQLVDRELSEERRELARLNCEVFLVHFHMAQALGHPEAQELIAHYRYHLAQQAIARKLAAQRATVDGLLNYLAGGPQLTQADLAEVINTFRQARQTLADSLEEARGLHLPKLKNFRARRRFGKVSPGRAVALGSGSGQPIP